MPPNPMAKPGYGKRSTPGQAPRRADDFLLLPERERYIAAFVDRLPDGAAMNVKTLAKQLPLYGQQAISTALTALSVAGHLRRVRRPVGEGEQVRWVFRTFWSRTARDNEWWTAYLSDENAPEAAPPRPIEEVPTPPTPATPAQEAPPAAEPPAAHTPDSNSPNSPAPESPSPAYLALARLGRTDPRLALSAADCASLEELAAAWLTRGVGTDYLVHALTSGLPAVVDVPRGFVRRRLRDKMPPHLPATATTAVSPATSPEPARRTMVECTRCGAPGRPEALPDGLCRACRTAPPAAPSPPTNRPPRPSPRGTSTHSSVTCAS
ncbi:MarR family transcriptional regulator [Streptomyces sp. NPDC052164]|uniref:MarR family transcriptional regulator n=1 Tax=Streptomyces sp. NPDC052164 TaxID=3155529 RepID=UPI003449DF72